MTYRIGWVSPLTPASGIGTFSKAVLDKVPTVVDGEDIDVTVLYVEHATIYPTGHRAVKIVPGRDFRAILGVFDLLVYNIGNNREHHEPIYELLLAYPGIVISHDYVYQHYLADRCARASRHFSSFAALLHAFAGHPSVSYLRRSQITSRDGRIRYSPWDSGLSVEQPMGEVLQSLGSALVLHSTFARRQVESHFDGPILQLGMPHDVKSSIEDHDVAFDGWRRSVFAKSTFELVSFGHIQSSKCIDLVIEAIGSCEALRRRVHYTVAGFVGDPAFFEELKSQVEALGLADIVRFEIGVSDRRLGELMIQTDVFINLRHPNTEAASLSLVEQLDAGRPVVVIDSGCYAEVPDDAAAKISPSILDATHLATTLHSLVDDPALMVEMGLAGRRYARSWTCRRYAKELIDFALAHRLLLKRRGQLSFNSARPRAALVEAGRWPENLRRARIALTYLDRGLLHVEPTLLSAMSLEDLCAYVSDVIVGVFGSRQLSCALSRYFAGLDRPAAFWACRTFALVADAVFGGDGTAAERLMNAKTCLDPAFWDVLELLPPRQFLTGATLLLGKRQPTAEELAECDHDIKDGYPIRLRLMPLLTRGEEMQALRLWAEEVRVPITQCELQISDDVDIEVGSAIFHSSVDLSGFHAIEPDRVWTRGKKGFVGVRLGVGTASVELLVYALVANAEAPREIGVMCGTRRVHFETHDGAERWIKLDVEVEADRAGSVFWFALSTNQAGPPPNSLDARVLGVCLRKLKVATRPAKADITEASRLLAVTQLSDAAQRMRSADKFVHDEALQSAG